MAKVDVRMPEDFLLKVSKLAEQTDVIIPKVLEVVAKLCLLKSKIIYALLLEREQNTRPNLLENLYPPLVLLQQNKTVKVIIMSRLGFQNREAMVVAMQKLPISLNMVNMGSLQDHF